jgi:hypothetical protein
MIDLAKLKQMVGACAYAGADAWSRNAAEAVKTCGAWV